MDILYDNKEQNTILNKNDKNCSYKDADFDNITNNKFKTMTTNNISIKCSLVF